MVAMSTGPGVMERAEASVRKGSGISNEPHRQSVSWTDKDHVSQGSADWTANCRRKVRKPGSNDLGKEIGLLYGGSLVMNAIIGPGIFGTPKGVLAGVGSVGMSMVMWTFSGIFSMCAALCFAELRESVKREGVEYAYITEAFGPVAGFTYTWMRIAAAEPTATAVFALAFTDYVGDAIYDECGPTNLFISVLATLTVLSVFLMNVMSSKLSERFQMLSSVGKLSALSVVIVLGVTRMIGGERAVIDEGFKATKWSPTDMAFACYNGLWAYGGWSNVNHVTSGIKKPPRNVPRVVKTVLPIVLVIYLLTVLSYFTAMTREELLHSRAIGVTWAQRILGPACSLIYIGVGLTALGSLNATFLSAGRLSGVAAKNGQIPDVASWVHVRSKTPLVASGLRCVIAVIVLLIADGQRLLRFYIFIVWLFHGASILALLILRYKNKKKRRPYKVDLWIPVVVVTGIVFLVIAPFLQKPESEFIAAVSLLGMSLISYYPIIWLKSNFIINVPDKITIWLQLFLRIAPKRDLRRERRSFLRQMSIFARNSIIITPNAMPSPAAMRRFSRRLSTLQMVHGSPAVVRRLGDTTGLRKRTTSRTSLAEIEARQRMRSNSMWNIGADSKTAPAIIWKKTITKQERSLSHPNIGALTSPASMPILKHKNNATHLEPKEKSTLGNHGNSQSMLSIPHHLLRHTHSPIPEEDSSGAKAADSSGDETQSQISQPGPDFQIIADFESDGGGQYEVLTPSNDTARMAYNVEKVSESNSNSTSTSDSDSSSSDKASQQRKSIFSSMFDSSSNSSSDSDSSLEEDGSNDEETAAAAARSYYSDDEITLHPSDNNSKTRGSNDNNGFVFDFDKDSESHVKKRRNSSLELQNMGVHYNDLPHRHL